MTAIDSLLFALLLLIVFATIYLYRRIVIRLQSSKVSAKNNERNRTLIRLFLANGILWAVLRVPSYIVLSILFGFKGVIRNRFLEHVCKNCSPSADINSGCSDQCFHDFQKYSFLAVSISESLIDFNSIANCVILIMLTKQFADKFLLVIRWEKLLKCIKLSQTNQ